MLTGSAGQTAVSLEAARNPTLCARMIKTSRRGVHSMMTVTLDAANLEFAHNTSHAIIKIRLKRQMKSQK